jgi:hypothetical protein
MSFPEVLQKIAAALDRAGVAYMLTGSFASAYYGSLRSTQDIDLVVSATPPQLQAFIQSLPNGEYYADLDAALEAYKRESLFNVIDLKTGWKIDLIIRKSRAFSHEEFGRRRPINLQGLSLFVASAEDVILAKLEWSKLAQSQRQIEDAAGIFKIQRNSLDRPYLEQWVRELGLEKEWKDALRAANISDLSISPE